MPIDASIYGPLIQAPPPQPFDPVRAIAEGQQLVAGQQANKLGQLNLQIQQRNIAGMQAYRAALQQNVDENGNVNDEGVAKTLTAAGFPDFANAHMQAAATTAAMRAQMQEAQNRADMLSLGIKGAEAASVGNSMTPLYQKRIDSVLSQKAVPMSADTADQVAQMTENPDATDIVPGAPGTPAQIAAIKGALPNTYDEFASAAGQQKVVQGLVNAGLKPEEAQTIVGLIANGEDGNDPLSEVANNQWMAMLARLKAHGHDVSGLAAAYDPDYVRQLQDTIQNRALNMMKLTDPVGYAKMQGDLEKTKAETAEAYGKGHESEAAAALSEAEASNMKVFGTKLTGKEALGVMSAMKKLYPGQSFNELSGAQQEQVLGEATASTADPAVRASLLAQRTLMMQLHQMELNQQPTEMDAAFDAQMLTSHLIAPSQLLTSLPRGAAGLHFKNMVLQQAKAMNPDFNWEQAESEYQLTRSTGFQNTIRYMDYVTSSADNLVKNANTLANGKVRSINALLNAGKDQFNNVNLAKFNTDRLEYADAVAKILQGGGGTGGTSDAKLAQAADLLRTTDDPQVVSATVGELSNLFSKRRTTLTRGTYLEKQSLAPESTTGGGTTGAGTTTRVTPPDFATMPLSVKASYNSGRPIKYVDPKTGQTTVWKKGPNGPEQVQ